MVKVPALFFSELLPQIDSLAELKVTLYCFWRLQHKKGQPFLRLSDLLSDRVLLTGLDVQDSEQRQALQDGLERSVARGTLLHVTVSGPRGQEDLYFLNSARGRAAIAALERGEWQLDEAIGEPIDLTIEHPTIFTLYEQNIGPLTSRIAELLRDAEDTYPMSWIEEAIDIAVRRNARNWAYVETILRRWQAEGKEEEPEGNEQQRYIGGKFGDFVEH